MSVKPPNLANTQTFSIDVPGVDSFTSADVTSYFPTGFMSTLPLSSNTGAFEYSDADLGKLLGETGPVVHPNLDRTIYARRMNSMLSQYGNPISKPWTIAAIGSMCMAVASAAVHEHGQGLLPIGHSALEFAIVLFGGLAVLSCFSVTDTVRAKPKDRSYSYLDNFTAQNLHVRWSEYWRAILTEGCNRKRSKDDADRVKDLGFRLSKLRNPRFAAKKDGTPISGVDVRGIIMMYSGDARFADITRLLWAIEVARRAVGRSIKMESRAMPANAKFFLKLGEALSGARPEGLSLPTPYSQPLADLLEGAALYSSLGNDAPTQAAVLAALLGRYYFDRGDGNNADEMKESMKYALKGKWGSAYKTHLDTSGRLARGYSGAELQVLSAMHHLGIASLMRERIIDGCGQEIIASAYAYAFSAARTFNDLSIEIPDAQSHLRKLMNRSLEIMHAMANNGPFVEFR